MRHYDFRRLVRTGALAAAMTIAGVSVPQVLAAQEVGEPEFMQEADVDTDGMDWGWLGLLGLAGLLGLRRRERADVHRVDTTASRRP